MPFVKLDCEIVDSSLWVARDERSVFLTALVKAKPFKLAEETAQLQVRSIEETGWKVPPGWYGLVRASGKALVRADGCDEETGLRALEALGNPDPDSRSPEYGGRRLVRVATGYLVLNFYKYRDRDYTAADRMQRLRDKRKAESGESSA